MNHEYKSSAGSIMV